MKYLILIIGLIFTTTIVKSQYDITYIDILELEKENQAKHLVWRYNKSDIVMPYFECNCNYCFELYEGDTQEKLNYFIFRRYILSIKRNIVFDWRLRLIPKRWNKYIIRYEFLPLRDQYGNMLSIE